ncbi:replication protein A 70 kDa DNA-binding subunit B [Tanacetum coccineum]
MGYQESPSLSNNTYRKNGGAGGLGSYTGSQSLLNNSYKKNVVIGGSMSSKGHGGSKSIGSAGRSGVRLIVKLFLFRLLWLSDFEGIRYKISFYKCTTVTRIEPFDNNTNGFIIEPFDHLLDPEHHQYYENDVVDVIGSVAGIGDIVPVMSAAGKKIRRTIVVEDADNRLDFTFWKTWASMWDQYANKHDTIEHLVIILQLGKVRYWDGIPAIHNALFGSKIFINRNILEIIAFKKRVKESDDYEANQVKIELFSPKVKVVSIAEFFHGAINRVAGGIRDSEPSMEMYNLHLGKKCLFKILYSEYNVTKNNHTYHCDSFSKDVELINHFKNNFIDTESDDEDSSDEYDSDMHTTTKTRELTSSIKGSSSKKRKLIIDLDEVESEPK